MLTRDELRETEDFFFDATPYVSDNEWNIDASLKADGSTSDLSAVARGAKADARPGRGEGRIMVIGFHVIRV